MKRDKVKDMVRSILPSTSRKQARWAKANAIRELRRTVNTEIRIEDPETTKSDWTRDVNVSWIVRERRGSDKLNHFMRWGDAITKGMSTEDALSHLRSLLPKNLIGEHAYGHWEQHRKPSRYRYNYIPYSRRLQSWIDSTRFHLRRVLTEDPSLHRYLNAVIKSRKPFDVKRRLLAGLHDIDDFVRDIAEADDCAPERAALQELIEGGPKGRPHSLFSSSSRRCSLFASRRCAGTIDTIPTRYVASCR
jgi:hypothetical protein